MISKNKLIELSEIRFEDIDISTLKELTEIKIDTKNNIEDRLVKFLDEIKNPYMFKVNNIPVRISFGDNHNITIDECLYRYFAIEKDL